MSTSDWNKYLHDRVICDKGGYYVIKPAEDQGSIPLSCNVCDFLYRTIDDERAHSEFNCCHKCALKWAHANRARWKDGWRPSRVQIDDEINSRPLLSIKLE